MQVLNRQHLAAAYRISLGLLTLGALVTQFLIGRAHPGFSAVNFFSYMTILGNLFGAIVFLCVGVSIRRSIGVDLMRGAATLYLAVIMIVYALLLSDIPLGIIPPWVNVVLHQIMPLAVLLDWLFAPPKYRLKLRWTLLWLAFPLVYVAYSLVRGANVDWYPYPFLDPGKVGGYAGIAGYCTGITVMFLLSTVLLTWLGNYMREKMPDLKLEKQASSR